MSDEDETTETILKKIVDVLEEHTRILQNHRQSLEHLFEGVRRIKEKVKILEAGNSLNPNDAKLVADVNARLKAISDTLDERA